jgi:hypothetical protein
MTTNKAIEVLKKYNDWRRGAEIEIPHPSEIGLAIEIVINEITTRRYKRERIKKTNNDENNNQHEKEMD